jgi:hypothetical protein
MPATHFASPEDAAMSGFSSRFCRVVASCVEGNDAVVLLDTRPRRSAFAASGLLRHNGLEVIGQRDAHG